MSDFEPPIELGVDYEKDVFLIVGLIFIILILIFVVYVFYKVSTSSQDPKFDYVSYLDPEGSIRWAINERLSVYSDEERSVSRTVHRFQEPPQVSEDQYDPPPPYPEGEAAPPAYAELDLPPPYHEIFDVPEVADNLGAKFVPGN